MSIFSQTNHEIFLITASDGERQSGFIATWVFPATLIPETPRIVAVISPMNYTYELIAKSRRFIVHLLASDQVPLVPRFGLESGRRKNKFEGLKIIQSKDGIPIIPGTCGWIECTLAATLNSGDRMICLADIDDSHDDPARAPLQKEILAAKLTPAELTALAEKRLRDGERDRALIKTFSA